MSQPIQGTPSEDEQRRKFVNALLFSNKSEIRLYREVFRVYRECEPDTEQPRVLLRPKWIAIESQKTPRHRGCDKLTYPRILKFVRHLVEVGLLETAPLSSHERNQVGYFLSDEGASLLDDLFVAGLI